MLGHNCGEATFIVPQTEFTVDLTGDEFALVCNFAELDGEGTRGVA